MKKTTNFFERPSVSRRDLLKIGAAAGAAATLPGQLLASSAPEASRSTKNIHLSLAAYSMRQALTKGGMTLFDFIDWCAELGLPGTELTSYYFQEGFDRSYLHRLRLRAFRNGVTVSGTAVRNNFCLPPGSERDRDIAHVKEWIDHAAELFAPHIRIFAGNVPEGVERSTAIGWVADSVLAVLEHASRRGVIIGLENHGGITARAQDHLAICDRVGEHPWFGINLDTGNYHADPYEELAMAAGRAVNVQVKAEISQGQKQVPADYERIKKILLDVNYRGWLALEYEAEADPRVEIPRHIKRLKQLFSNGV